MKHQVLNKGFTLIELMIVVVVIAVLAAIAIPAYQNYVERARRADAKSALLAVQLAQEKYRANNPTYGTLAEIGAAASSPDGYYNITVNVNAGPPSTYTATATRTGKQANDTKCGNFSINQNNVQSVTGSLSAADCWQR
ncbi:MAG: type IV pilin protein [Methylophaga sp.]